MKTFTDLMIDLLTKDVSGEMFRSAGPSFALVRKSQIISPIFVDHRGLLQFEKYIYTVKKNIKYFNSIPEVVFIRHR